MKAALGLLLVLAALLPPALADQEACERPTLSLGRVEIGDRTPENTWYVDDRGVAKNGVWLYEESNGVFVGGIPERDLQRGGSAGIPLDEDLCVDDPDVPPDTLVA